MAGFLGGGGGGGAVGLAATGAAGSGTAGAGAMVAARMQARNFSSLLSDLAKICTLQALQVMQANCFLLTVNRAFALLHTGQTPCPIRFSFAIVTP